MHTRPQVVTRFYGNSTFAGDVMEYQRVALVNVSKLNDPFDPYYYFENNFGDSFDRVRTYIRLNDRQFFDIFERRFTRAEFMSGLRAVRDFFAHRAKTTYVLSTASDRGGLLPSESLYMWGHYGNGHRGVAIDFRTDRLQESLLDHNRKCGNPDPVNPEVWIETEYLTVAPPITAQVYAGFLRRALELSHEISSNASSQSFDDFLSRMLRLKGEDWRREAKWRLMWGRDDNIADVYYCPILPEAISAIYFGLRLAEEDRRRLECALTKNYPEVPIRRARKRHGNFAVEFV